MRIRSISCAGFRGMREEFRLDVPEGFLVITGRNGAGKSSVCDVVEYALSGSIRRYAGESDRREGIDDYLWWRGQGKPASRYVSVELVDQDGNVVEIRRTPRGLETPTQEAEIVDLLFDRGRAPSRPIHRVLQTSVIRDEEITQLSVDLPEAQRFQFVREAVGEADFSNYAHLLGTVGNDLKDEADRYAREYEGTRETIARLVEEIADRRSNLASETELAEAHQLLVERLDPPSGSESLLQAAQRFLLDTRQRLAAMERFMPRVKEIHQGLLRSEADDYRSRREELLRREEELARELEEATAARQIADAKIEELETDERHMAWSQLLQRGTEVGLRDGRCPLCGSEIDEESLADHVSHARAAIREINDTVTVATEAQVAAAARERDAEAAWRAVRQEVAAQDEAEAKLHEAHEEVVKKLGELGLPDPILPEDLARRIEAGRSEVREVERAMLLIQSSSVAGEIDELEERLAGMRTEGSAQHKMETRVRAKWESTKNTLDAIRRIEGEIIEERLSALGPLLEELYLRLRPHLDWPRIRYHIRGDVKRFLSLKVGDEELNPRFMFSSGQRRAIGLAFLLAAHLSTDWTRLATLILDDPVQHIDDFRALHLVELLASLRKGGQQIVCTAEDAELAELLVRRLRGGRDEVGALVTLEYQPGRGATVSESRFVRPISERVLESA